MRGTPLRRRAPAGSVVPRQPGVRLPAPGRFMSPSDVRPERSSGCVTTPIRCAGAPDPSTPPGRRREIAAAAERQPAGPRLARGPRALRRDRPVGGDPSRRPRRARHRIGDGPAREARGGLRLRARPARLRGGHVHRLAVARRDRRGQAPAGRRRPPGGRRRPPLRPAHLRGGRPGLRGRGLPHAGRGRGVPARLITVRAWLTSCLAVFALAATPAAAAPDPAKWDDGQVPPGQAKKLETERVRAVVPGVDLIPGAVTDAAQPVVTTVASAVTAATTPPAP